MLLIHLFSVCEHYEIQDKNCTWYEQSSNLYIPTEQRNCEILKLLQIYKNDQKSKFMLTYMLFKIFLRQLHKMVRKYSPTLRIWCMEGRRGHLQFRTFSRKFIYRWHLTMEGMKTWPNLSKYRRRSQKLYSINCGQDGHVYKTNICTFIHSFYTLPWWCVFLKHKIQCWPICVSAQIEKQYVMSKPTVHLVSKNWTLR